VTSVPPIGLIIAGILGFGLGLLIAASDGIVGDVILLVSVIAFIAGCERAWKERSRRER
jgi:hypothetical protein